MPEPRNLPTRPTDGGWAWMVLVGSFLVRMLTEGFAASMGVFFVEWQKFFDASAADVAWTGSALTMAWFVSGPFVGALTIRYGCRKIVLLGGVVMMASMTFSSFATEMWHLYITMTLEGLGVGLAVQPTMVVLAYHFDKKLARVNGIAHAGVAIGIITLPPMFQLLINEYGWQGTALITAAYLGNICVSGALYRKPKYEYTVLRRRSTIESFKLEERERRASIRRASKAEIRASVTSRSSRKSITSIPAVKKTKKTFGRTCQSVTDFLQFPLMKDNPRFLMMCVLSFGYAIGYTSATFYLVPRAVAVGISPFQASFLMSIMGICSLVARLTHGMLVDKGWISAAYLDAIAYGTCGIASILSVFAKDYVTSMVFSVVYGTSSGVFNSLYPVVTKDFVGTEKLSDAIGVMHFILGIGSLMGVYFLGFFYDVSGSYEYSFYISGVALLFCTALLCSHKWLQKWEKTDFDFDKHGVPQPTSSGSDDGSDDVFEAMEDKERDKQWKLGNDEIIEIEEKPKVTPTDLKEIHKVRDDPSIKEVIDTYVPSKSNGYAKLNGDATCNGDTKLNGASKLNGILKTSPINSRQAVSDYVYIPKAYHWIHKETQV